MMLPNEKYIFNFTQSEIKEINKSLTNHKKAIVLQVLFVIIFLLLVGLVTLSRFVSDILEGFFLGILIVYILIMIISYLQNKKLLKANNSRISNNTYQYEFFDEYVLVNIADATSTRCVHIKYSDITITKNRETLYAFEYAGMFYFLRKTDLIPNAKITTL